MNGSKEVVELAKTYPITRSLLVYFSEHPANPKTYEYVNGIFG